MKIGNSKIKQLVLDYLEGRETLHIIWQKEKKMSYLDHSGILEFNYMGSNYLALYIRVEPMHNEDDDIYRVNYCELST